MTKKCELTGKNPMKGHNVSHANNKTKRRFLPNLKKVKFTSEILKRSLKINVSNAAVRSVDKKGTFDQFLKSAKNKVCVIGLVADPERLADIRRNRVAIMKDSKIKEYTNIDFIKDEVSRSKKLFNKYKWPIIDVSRKSVEETAASILKIFEINKNK